MARIYLDTCVYMDYLEDRCDNIRPLGEFAFQLLKRTFKCEFNIVVSDWLLTEMEKHENVLPLFLELLKRLGNTEKVIFVTKTESTEKEAKELCKKGFHLADALHAVLAGNAGAEYIVTRNIKDFPANYGSAKVVFPENI
jgi:predicted nucleic acid-binding protein